MKTNELFHILIAIIVSAFVVSFTNLGTESYSFAFLFFLIIFILNIATKKLTAYSMQCDTEIKIWHFQRYGLYERSHFKTPIPIGIILPFIISILTLGKVPFLATTQTEITASKAKVAKRQGIYRYSEITDFENGLIPAAGIAVILFFAIVAYFLGVPDFSKYAILFASFNMLPLGHLDGTKIFFGSKVLYAILGVLCLIGLSYIFLLV